MRSSLLLLALCLSGCSANADSQAKDAGDVVMIAEDDAEMEAAVDAVRLEYGWRF